MSDKKKYINAVSKNIKCLKNDKAPMIAKLLASVEEIFPGNPTYEQLVQSFGEPKQVAEELSGMISRKALKRYRLRKAEILLYTLFMLAVAAVIVWTFM